MHNTIGTPRASKNCKLSLIDGQSFNITREDAARIEVGIYGDEEWFEVETSRTQSGVVTATIAKRAIIVLEICRDLSEYEALEEPDDVQS